MNISRLLHFECDRKFRQLIVQVKSLSIHTIVISRLYYPATKDCDHLYLLRPRNRFELKRAIRKDSNRVGPTSSIFQTAHADEWALQFDKHLQLHSGGQGSLCHHEVDE